MTTSQARKKLKLKPRVKPEKVIQREILKWLEKTNILHWRQNSGALFVGTPGKGGRLVTLGTAGLPDIILVVPPGGRFVGLEVKSAIGSLRPAQKEFQKKLESAGGSYHVVRSLLDAKAVVEAEITDGDRLRSN